MAEILKYVLNTFPFLFTLNPELTKCGIVKLKKKKLATKLLNVHSRCYQRQCSESCNERIAAEDVISVTAVCHRHISMQISMYWTLYDSSYNDPDVRAGSGSVICSFKVFWKYEGHSDSPRGRPWLWGPPAWAWHHSLWSLASTHGCTCKENWKSPGALSKIFFFSLWNRRILLPIILYVKWMIVLRKQPEFDAAAAILRVSCFLCFAKLGKKRLMETLSTKWNMNPVIRQPPGLPQVVPNHLA